MSEAYEKVKGGRLAFKGGDLATRAKTIDKKNKNKKKKNKQKPTTDLHGGGPSAASDIATEVQQVTEDVYTIDPMKKMKYDDLFPVECKKFGYDPKAKSVSVELALDDRVKKKADRYCK